jgi:regulatory protein spx
MIKIYRHSPGVCQSFKKVLEWCEFHQIDYEVCSLNSLTKSDLIQMFHLSEQIEQLFITRTERKRQVLQTFSEQSFTELVQVCLEQPHLLKEPILMDERRLQVGYNAEEIRMFLPREIRRMELKNFEKIKS